MLKKPPERVSYRKSQEIIDLPNLIEIQIKSYKQFLQADIMPHEREKIGLEEVFQEIFPIKSYDEKTVLEYLDAWEQSIIDAELSHHYKTQLKNALKALRVDIQCYPIQGIEPINSSLNNSLKTIIELESNGAQLSKNKHIKSTTRTFLEKMRNTLDDGMRIDYLIQMAVKGTELFKNLPFLE